MGEICAQLLVSFEKINSQYDKIRIDNAELASDNLYQEETHSVKLRVLEKKITTKIAEVRALAWKVRDSKTIRKVLVKNKQLKQKLVQDKKSIWKLLRINANEKFVAQRAVDDLKLRNEEIKELRDDLDKVTAENRLLVKENNLISSQNQSLIKTNSQNLEKQKSKLRELRTRMSELESQNRQKSIQISQFEDEKRKIFKKFEKEQSTWNKTADRFEIDRNKWRNFFMQVTKEMKNLKKENRRNKKVIDVFQLKEKEDLAREEEEKNKKQDEEEFKEDEKENQDDSKVDLDSFMCSICFDSFFEAGVRPQVLECGHVYCSGCVTGTIFKLRNAGVPCPNCRHFCALANAKLIYFS